MIGWLLDRFATVPAKPAMIWRDEEYSYGWLVERVAHWKAVVASRSCGPRTVVAIEGDYSPEVCALFLALADQRAVVVPLTSAVEANKPTFYTIAEVHAIFRFDRDGGWTFVRRDTEVAHPLTRSLIDAGRPGLVVFSSGSTGQPKAVLHDLTRLLEKFRVVRHARRTITFLLLDHLGGINTLFSVLSNLGTIVSIEARDPDSVCRAIERHRVELLPTTPTFLNLLLLSEAARRYDLSSLTLITYGTEVMPPTTLKRLHDLFPGVVLSQTYGMSELGVLRAKSKGSESLFVKIGGEGFETKIVDNTLWIRATSAMLGYLNAPSPFDAEGWMNTGDEVEVDGEYIRFLGRRSEVINVGGEKVYPVEIENVLMEMPNVRDVTVHGQPNPLTGQMVVARVQLKSPEPLVEFRNRVREFCRGRLAKYKIPAKIELVSGDQHSERFKRTR
jgi:acyl-CoA synthetase (AMP-forming)/AMP-acid ligase II